MSRSTLCLSDLDLTTSRRAPEPLALAEAARGMGRSPSFPLHEWRAHDAYRTVFFDEGNGRPLVFVHGLGGNVTHWEPIVGRFAGRYRVAGLDLVGCGWSHKPRTTYNVELLRDHLLEFLDSRGIGHATLLGHSMGGAVCIAAALMAPERVSSLVLVASTGLGRLPGWMRWAGPLFLRRSLLRPMLLHGADIILDRVFVASAEDNEHVRWFRDVSLRDEPGYPGLRDFARVCETLCRDLLGRDFTSELARIRVPVLALLGEADPLSPPPRAIAALNRLPRVRTIVLPRCGHLPMVEQPDETASAIDHFLASPP